MDPKRDRILVATVRLMRQHGYRKVTMSDIADAAEISRPTLYAEFPNKEAVMSAIVEQHAEALTAATATRLTKLSTLKARLRLLFEIWVVEPFAEVADNPEARDLIDNIGSFIPDTFEAFYARFEQELLRVLEPEITGRRPIPTAQLAHVLALATKGLKISSASVAELRDLLDGLIAMTIAT